MKYCPKCKKQKEIKFFSFNKSKFDGLQSYCKMCSTTKKDRSDYMQKYRVANKEKNKIKQDAWRVNNYERYLSTQNRNNHVRRARRYAAATEKVIRESVFERDNWICQICFSVVDLELKWPHPMSKSLDHILPLSLGGSESYANSQLAHLECNQKEFAVAKAAGK